LKQTICWLVKALAGRQATQGCAARRRDAAAATRPGQRATARVHGPAAGCWLHPCGHMARTVTPTCWNDDQLASLEGARQLIIAREGGHLHRGADVAEVRCHARCVGHIEQHQLAHQVAALQQQRQRLADTTSSAQHSYLGLHRGSWTGRKRGLQCMYWQLRADAGCCMSPRGPRWGQPQKAQPTGAHLCSYHWQELCCYAFNAFHGTCSRTKHKHNVTHTICTGAPRCMDPDRYARYTGMMPDVASE
jgi:hypothetical protein